VLQRLPVGGRPPVFAEETQESSGPQIRKVPPKSPLCGAALEQSKVATLRYAFFPCPVLIFGQVWKKKKTSVRLPNSCYPAKSGQQKKPRNNYCTLLVCDLCVQWPKQREGAAEGKNTAATLSCLANLQGCPPLGRHWEALDEVRRFIWGSALQCAPAPWCVTSANTGTHCMR